MDRPPWLVIDNPYEPESRKEFTGNVRTRNPSVGSSNDHRGLPGELTYVSAQFHHSRRQ